MGIFYFLNVAGRQPEPAPEAADEERQMEPFSGRKCRREVRTL